ncbi:MAG TPA: DM13 domain-containing protein [Iamia sp.]
MTALPPPPPPGAPTLPDHLRPPAPRRSRRPFWIGGGVIGLAAVAFLAFGVFGVQALWIDDEVAEAAPTFSSGATLPTATTTAPAAGDSATAPPTTAATPTVRVAATGAFADRGHAGEGTANVLTDGTQSFVRFEADFATDNGPDLRVRAHAGDEIVDLGPLKGNIGAQNYELPADLDPATVTSVDVWCRRFDYVFTTADLTPA